MQQFHRHDPLAQLGERLGDNQEVTGSSPVWVTNKGNPLNPMIQGVLLYAFGWLQTLGEDLHQIIPR